MTARLAAPAQVKQSWHMVDKSFIVTSNARNEHMLKEAGDFANHLKHCEKDIRALKNATEGGSLTAHSLHTMRDAPFRPAGSPWQTLLAGQLSASERPLG